MQDFAKKTVFITGGASGVGLGIAKAFAKQKANVVIADIQPDRLIEAEQQLRTLTNAVLAIEVDTTDIVSLQRAKAEIETTFDLLACCAITPVLAAAAKYLKRRKKNGGASPK